MSSDQGVTIRGADGKLYFVASVGRAAACIPQPEAREEAAPRAQRPVSGVSRHFVPVALCLIAEPGEGETPQRADVAFMPVALCVIADSDEGRDPEAAARAARTFMPVALCIIADNNDGGGGETATEATAGRARAA
jgi:hypothetical protein